MTPANTLPAVVRAGLADADDLGDLIAAAYGELDVSRWLVADPEVRAEIFPLYFRMFVEHVLTAGLVHTTEDRAAVALWLPAGLSPPVPPYGYPDQLAAVTGSWLDRFLIIDELFEQAHPRGRPHHFLALLAVRPDRQRRGLSTTLLRAHHATLDAAGLPAYLQASGQAARALYAKLGYQDDGPPLRLPAGPSVYPMWRAPVNRRSAG